MALVDSPAQRALSDFVVVDSRLSCDDWGDCHTGHPHHLPEGESLLHALPADVELRVISKLTSTDKKALRATYQRARQVLNEQVERILLPASSLSPGCVQRISSGSGDPEFVIRDPTPARLGERFPAASRLVAHDDPTAPVTDNALRRVLLESPALLARLQEVDVKKCHYVGRGLLSFLADACPQLQCLAPSRWVDNGAMWDVARFAELRELKLGDSEIDILTVDDMGLAALPSMGHLEYVSLQRCRWVGDNGCMSLAQVSSLKRLDLSQTDVGARGLAWLAGLPHLHTLDLSECRNIDDAALAALAPLTGLACLAIKQTGVTNAGLVHLNGLRLLAELDLGSRFEVNDEGLAYLAACPSLRRLAAGSFNLGRPAPPAGFGCLRELSFGGSFANKGLDLLFPLPALRALHVQGIDAVTDNVMKHVGSQKSLEQLVLRAGYNLTDAGLDQLAGLDNLSLLSLSACPAISRACLGAFVGAHQRLRDLLVGVACPVRAGSRDATVAAAASA